MLILHLILNIAHSNKAGAESTPYFVYPEKPGFMRISRKLQLLFLEMAKVPSD
jgi:hypothetical protein